MFRSIIALSLLAITPLFAGQATFGQSSPEMRPEMGDKTQLITEVTGWIENVSPRLTLNTGQKQQLESLYLKEIEHAFTGARTASSDKEAINQTLVDAWQRLRNIHSAASGIIGQEKADLYFELERQRMVNCCLKHLAPLSLAPVQEARIREILSAEADMMLKFTKEDLRHRQARTDMANKMRRRGEQSERDIEAVLNPEQKNSFGQIKGSLSANPLKFLG